MNVVITGGSKGMGKAMAEKFAAHGYTIYLCARNEARLKATADELSDQFPETDIFYFAADLSKRNEVSKFSEYLLSQLNTIDILINNAGNFVPGNVSDEPEGALETMIETNLYSAYHLTRDLLPVMVKRRQGHIFNICSIASLQPYNNGGAYSISKFALMGFSKNLREECKKHLIKVTSVYPGAVYTDSWAGSGISPERIMASSDIAELIFTAANLSPQACVEEIMIRPILGDLP